jgi:hypothetical protein
MIATFAMRRLILLLVVCAAAAQSALAQGWSEGMKDRSPG